MQGKIYPSPVIKSWCGNADRVVAYSDGRVVHEEVDFAGCASRDWDAGRKSGSNLVGRVDGELFFEWLESRVCVSISCRNT